LPNQVSVLSDTELEFLGHIAGSGNIKPVQDKVSAIRQFPFPVTKKQINLNSVKQGHYKYNPSICQMLSVLYLTT
jgi:hypothetical protein